MALSGEAAKYLRWLGVEDESPRDFYVTLFIPSQTRDGEPLDHEYWRDAAVRVMSELFGGATSMRPGQGPAPNFFEMALGSCQTCSLRIEY